MSRSVVCLLKSSRLAPALFLGFAVAASTAFAQSTSSTQYSSSAADSLDEGVSTLSYHAPASGQNSGGYGQGGYHQYSGEPDFHHIAIEAGAGFDAPIGNTKNAQTFGYNIKLGGGWNFNPRFGVLLEYEFNHTGIPNNVLAAVGAPQGNVHLWGFTLDPIYYYKRSGSWGGYVTGGGGFYRKLTTFSQPVNLGLVCNFFGCFEQIGNQTLFHFSSNQGGLNIGTGLTHNIGNGAKIYAEARYLWVNSPSSTATSVGSGTVSMIPVTFGVRF